MKRCAWLVFAVLVTGFGSRAAAAEQPVVVQGRPVTVRVVLVDAAGQPVAGADVQLVARARFMGFDRDVIVDETRTGKRGEAFLRFAWTQRGTIHGAVRFNGSGGLVASRSDFVFDVRQPVPGLVETRQGLHGPFARSAWVLLPVIVVWAMYLTVFARLRTIRRAGAAAPRPAVAGGAA